MTLRERALNLLARREHSRAELARKLAPHVEDEDLDGLLDDLEREKLLSNARYAEMLAHARSGRHGSLRLKADLRDKGVPAEVMESTLAEAREHDLEAASAVWLKKFGEPPRDAGERAKQMRFLAGRGFPPDVVRRVVGGEED
ncbi:MAG TPA: recombination regulator RecX [Thiobacillaceae bacterium]|nr:recombination regulator RecX [Thiobacillaceae bacterium]HNH89923.1 recombination regulator RecX [Thiobacillaceae bacterium]